MNDPLTICCDCGDALCGMTLTVLPMGAHFKLTMTPQVGKQREPAVEWIHGTKLAERLEEEDCATFGTFTVHHFLQEEMDLDMLISEDNRQVLLALAKGAQKPYRPLDDEGAGSELTGWQVTA